MEFACQSGSAVKVGSGHGKVEACCEHDYEPLWSTKFGVLLEVSLAF
jgi:hypothetical protein